MDGFGEEEAAWNEGYTRTNYALAQVLLRLDRPQEATPRAYWRLVRDNRNFRLVWLAQIVSELGDWLYSIAIYSLLLELTGSAKSVASPPDTPKTTRRMSPGQRAARRSPNQARGALIRWWFPIS